MKSETQKNKNWKKFGNSKWSRLPRRERLKADSKQQNKRRNAVRLLREKLS